MATQGKFGEKVDAVIVGAGASGSVFAATLAKAGKKVAVLETGPDWQLSDLISSDIWGPATATSRAGVSAARRCITSRISRGCCRPTSR